MRFHRRNDVKCRRRRHAGAALLLCLAFFLFSFPVYAEEEYPVTKVEMEGKVNTSSSLNIRSGPGTSYSVISKADGGTPLSITGQTEEGDEVWYQVEIDGRNGYVRSDYVTISETVQGADGEQDLEPEAGEPEGGYRGFYQKPVFLKAVMIGVGILLVLIMLVFTLKGLRKDRGGDADYDEDGYDNDGYDNDYDNSSYDESGYDGEGYEDMEEDGGYEEEYEDGEYDDMTYGEAYADDEACAEEYEDDEACAEDGYDDDGAKNRGRKDAGRKAYILREEDYLVQIDPSYFEDKEPIEQPAMVTGYLEQKLIEEAARAHEVELRDEELQQADGDLGDKQRELEQAMAKLNELQKEIERMKGRK